MTRCLHGWPGIIAIGAWLAAAGSAEASPPYARTAAGGLLSQARGKSDDDVVALRHEASGRLTRDACALEIDVVNTASDIHWNIVVIVGQALGSALAIRGLADTDRDGARPELTTIRIPYLPSHEATTIRVPCLSAARYDYSNRTIEYGTQVTSSVKLAPVIDELATTRLATTLTSPVELLSESEKWATRKTTEPPWLLEAIVAFDDPEVAEPLVAAIAGRGVAGARMLGEIAARPQSNLARHVDAAIVRMAPEAQLAVASVRRELEAAAADRAATAARLDQRRAIAGVLGLLLPLAIGASIARRRLRSRLPEAEAEAEAGAPAPPDREARLGARLAHGLAGGVARARRELAIAAVSDPVVEQAAATVRRAVGWGVAASRLVRDGGATYYLVALPIGDAPSEVLQRHLGAPWLEHARQVAALAGSAITSLIVLCGPDAMTATLLVGYDDTASSSVPDALLDPRDARVHRTNSFRHAISLAE